MLRATFLIIYITQLVGCGGSEREKSLADIGDQLCPYLAQLDACGGQVIKFSATLDGASCQQRAPICTVNQRSIIANVYKCIIDQCPIYDEEDIDPRPKLFNLFADICYNQAVAALDLVPRDSECRRYFFNNDIFEP